MWISVALAAVVIAVTGAALLLPRLRGGPVAPNRILVVAFANESGPEGSATLGTMAQDYIIQVLTEAGFAEVVDPLSALAVSQNVAAARVTAGLGDILTLADEAGAGTVVSGRYYTEGDSVHIQTRVSDARDGKLLGTVGPTVGSSGALRELVARLGQEVVAALALLLDRELGSWEPAAQPATYDAYEAYSEGLKAYLRDDQPDEAARHFERAVAADPTFSTAALWAAQSYFLLQEGPGGWARYARAESLIAPLVESREQLRPFERCRLDFVMALGPSPSGDVAGNVGARQDRGVARGSAGGHDIVAVVGPEIAWPVLGGTHKPRLRVPARLPTVSGVDAAERVGVLS